MTSIAKTKNNTPTFEKNSKDYYSTKKNNSHRIALICSAIFSFFTFVSIGMILGASVAFSATPILIGATWGFGIGLLVATPLFFFSCLQ